ncbi:DUF305 domain-containing protein [Roseomonas sp. HJA6]|uniref:DUF305 domain-containing protein n=1 Tax=Roseomonas alba TaxID=2846776 RepID=A0ABS7A437_9PROT|nr:DUF305 domain-containing protein [Neoroseomonas alba]MBW6397053.1 DUF305 domain-containing protein [Neoroseomonas alba]
MQPLPVSRRSSALLLAAALLGTRAARAADAPVAPEAAFLAENEEAMDRMMAAMAVHPTGDIDRDFVEMMIPHHQGAIDMAQAVLRYGRNQQIRRIAQEIIVEQQQEIVAMRLALGDPLPAAAPAPDQTAAPASAHHHHGSR